MYKVYKVINKKSKTYYIGMTKQTIQRRFNQHRSGALRGVETPFYDAMRSYGISNFSIEILKTFEDLESCCAYEIELIAQGKKDKETYNLHSGGQIGYAIPLNKRVEWIKKLKLARVGRRPALGMKHSAQNKSLFKKVSKEYWDSVKTYDPKEVLKLSFKLSHIKYGISKTHYYRLKNRAFFNEER